jgi:hypothetical protein
MAGAPQTAKDQLQQLVNAAQGAKVTSAETKLELRLLQQEVQRLKQEVTGARDEMRALKLVVDQVNAHFQGLNAMIVAGAEARQKAAAAGAGGGQ